MKRKIDLTNAHAVAFKNSPPILIIYLTDLLERCKYDVEKAFIKILSQLEGDIMMELKVKMTLDVIYSLKLDTEPTLTWAIANKLVGNDLSRAEMLN